MRDPRRSSTRAVSVAKPDPTNAKGGGRCKGLGRPFGLIIDTDGNILMQNGQTVGLPNNIVGFLQRDAGIDARWFTRPRV